MFQIRSFVAAYLLTSSRAFSPSSIPNIKNANTRKQHSHLYASDAEDDRRSFLTKGAGIALVLGVGFAFQSKILDHLVSLHLPLTSKQLLLTSVALYRMTKTRVLPWYDLLGTQVALMIR